MSIPCSFDTYNPLPKAYLSTNCTRCPERTSTRVLPVIDGRANLDDCKCDVGFWQAPVGMDVASIESCQQAVSSCILSKACGKRAFAFLDAIHHLAVHVYKIPNKLKIIISFYQVATRFEKVYEVYLPGTVRELLYLIRIVISFMIEAIPLACLGLHGYLDRLIFWMLVPIVAIVLSTLAVTTHLCSSRRFTGNDLFDALVPVILRISFLAYPIVTNVAFEAFSCFEFRDGRSFLIADVRVECYADDGEHAEIISWAWIAIFAYPIGLFVLNAVLLFAARHAILSGVPSKLSKATSFLHREFVPHFYFWELAEMARRFLLVGLFIIFPYKQGTMMQVAVASFFASLFLIAQLQAMPYRSQFDNYIAVSSSASLVFMLICIIFYKYASFTDQPDILAIMPAEQLADYNLDSVVFTFVFIICTVGTLAILFVLALVNLGQERKQAAVAARNAKARRLRYVHDHSEVVLGRPVIPANAKPPNEVRHVMMAISRTFHIFLSHVWGTGQDQMRVVKQRLQAMLPDVAAFLDVDDLEEGFGAEYVDVSSMTLVFCSKGYFVSPNCMRELLRAVVTKKPIVTMLEPEEKHGGLSQEQIHEQLDEADSRYNGWGLTAEVASWGYAMPNGQELFDALFAREPLEWNRVGVYQDVTMRVLAEHLLPPDHRPVFLQGELTYTAVELSPPTHTYHVYASPLNPGAADLLTEVANAHNFQLVQRGAEPTPSGHSSQRFLLKPTTVLDDLPECDCMLVYLTGQTWTRGDETTAFAAEVKQAMERRTPLLLAHEMPGVGGQAARHACLFDIFFANAGGATPQPLLQLGIYRSIATALKGGEWRKTSMVLISKALEDRTKPPPPSPEAEGEAEASSTQPTSSSSTNQPREGLLPMMRPDIGDPFTKPKKKTNLFPMPTKWQTTFGGVSPSKGSKTKDVEAQQVTIEFDLDKKGKKPMSEEGKVRPAADEKGKKPYSVGGAEITSSSSEVPPSDFQFS